MPAGQGSLLINIRHRLTSLERRYSSYGPPAGGSDTAGAVHRHVPFGGVKDHTLVTARGSGSRSRMSQGDWVSAIVTNSQWTNPK